MAYVQEKTLVFNRWSRQSWSAFAARGKQVRIGVLGADISNQAYNKAYTSGKAISMLYVSPCQSTSSYDYDEGIHVIASQSVALISLTTIIFIRIFSDAFLNTDILNEERCAV